MENLENNVGIQEIKEGILGLEDLRRELEELDQRRNEILSKIMEMDPGFEDPKHSDIEEAYEQLLYQNEELENRLAFEGMTGLYSKAYMTSDVFPEMFQEKREGEENRKTTEGDDKRSILMIDADKFKLVNDTYGHDVGDEVLKKIAEVVKQCVRFTEDDYPSRWGGEEILVLLTKASPYESQKVAERINKKIKEAKILENILGIDNLKTLDVTVSIGVAAGDKYSDWKEMLKNADKALYYSKNNGRDKVSVNF